MNGEDIFGCIIMIFCGFVCGGIFYGIGVWADKRKDPVHFYSGTTVDPRTISDIPAYNRANAKMWKAYSIPYWLTGLTGILSFWDRRISVLCIVFILWGCTIGIFRLIRKYKRICDTYMIR